MDVEVAAARLHAAGQQRAHLRAEAVDALRLSKRKHPLVMAVLERWGLEAHEADDVLVGMAEQAVSAVLNCTQVETE